MAKTVRLYEDIDGCLNAEYNARAWRQDGDVDQAGYQRAFVSPKYDDFGKAIQHEGYRVKYRMEWNDRLVAALNELPVEFVWTTTWRGDALQVGKAMKLLHDPQRILHPLNGQTTFPSIEWKFEAIVTEQESDPSPFIAVDDEWWQCPRAVIERLEELGGLVISPDPNIGLTPKHISMMKAYIEQHA